MSDWWHDTASTIFFGVCVVLVIGIFVWVGWLTRPPTSGYVRDKNHTEQYSHYHPGTSSCAGYDSNGHCTYTISTPSYWHEHCVGGCWELYLSDCKIKDGKKKCRKGWITVSETAYNNYNIGDHYPDPK